jgi:hypothetical protein
MSHSEIDRSAEAVTRGRTIQMGRFCNPRRGLQPMNRALRMGHPTTNHAAGRVPGVVFDAKASRLWTGFAARP